MMKAIAFAIVALCIAGCASAPKYLSIDSFRQGQVVGFSNQTADQVLAQLGPPTRKIPHAKGSECWEYTGAKQSLVVYFRRGVSPRVGACAAGNTVKDAHRTLAQVRVQTE